MTMIVVLILEISAIYCEASKKDRKEDHIDPNDIMNFDQVNMKMSKNSEKGEMKQKSSDAVSENDKTREESANDKIKPAMNDVNQNIENKQCFSDATNSQSTALFRQYVMILVDNLESQVGSATPVNMNLRLKVSKHDIYKLKEYGQGRRSDAHEVHEVLSHITQFAAKAEEEELRFYWLEEKLGLSTTNFFLSLALVFSIMLLVKMIQNTVFTFRLVTQVFIIVFIISFLFTWISLYQEALAEQEKFLSTQKYSKACPQPEDQSFLQRAFTFAVAVVIVKTLVSPVGIVGTAISTFMTASLKDLPVQWQLVVAGFIIGLVFFLICVISGYEIRSIFFSIQRPPRGYHQPIQNFAPAQPIAGVYQNHENRNIIQNRIQARQQPIARRPVAPAVEGIAAPAVEGIAAPTVERIAAPADAEPVVNLALPQFHESRQETHQQSDSVESVLDDAVEGICDTLSQQQISPILDHDLTNQIQQIRHIRWWLW